MRRTSTLPALILPLLAACSGGTSTPTPSPAPTPTPGSGITARLAACPLTNSPTSDPAASTCLAGTYAGKTPAGADCTLNVAADGSYTFASPTLNFTYTANTQANRVFGHQNPQNTQQVIWLISDPISADEPKELDFEARWGTYAQNPQLTIEATKHLAGGGSVSASCALPL